MYFDLFTHVFGRDLTNLTCMSGFNTTELRELIKLFSLKSLRTVVAIICNG